MSSPSAPRSVSFPPAAGSARRLRVALAGAFPETDRSLRGGVEAVTFALAAEMGRRDEVELHVVSVRRDGGPDQTLDRGSYTLHLLEPANPLPYSLRVTGADVRTV